MRLEQMWHLQVLISKEYNMAWVVETIPLIDYLMTDELPSF